LLQSIRDYDYGELTTSCIMMPRLRFGNYEENTTTTAATDSRQRYAPNGFNDADFQTLKWQWRAALQDRKTNRNPKSMVNVKNIHNFSRQDTDAHRPVRSACPQRDLYMLNRDSPFVVHHYIGTKEQYEFRKDARDGMKQRNPKRFAEYGQIKQGGKDDSICGWLDDFVGTHGYEQSRKWLEGVGNVSYTPVPPVG
jgi:hypothetical protein